MKADVSDDAKRLCIPECKDVNYVVVHNISRICPYKAFVYLICELKQDNGLWLMIREVYRERKYENWWQG